MYRERERAIPRILYLRNFGRSLLRTHYGKEPDLGVYDLGGEVWIFDFLPSKVPLRKGPNEILSKYFFEEIRVGTLSLKGDLLEEALKKLLDLPSPSLEDQYLKGEGWGLYLFEKISKSLNLEGGYESTPQGYKVTNEEFPNIEKSPLYESDAELIKYLNYRSGPNPKYKKLSLEVLEVLRGALEEGIMTQSRLEYLQSLLGREEALDWPKITSRPVAILCGDEERTHVPLRELLHEVADLFEPQSQEIHLGGLREAYERATEYLGLEWPLKEAVPSRYVTFKGLVVDLPKIPFTVEGLEVPLSGQALEELSLEELKALEVYFARTNLSPSKTLDLFRSKLVDLISHQESQKKE